MSRDNDALWERGGTYYAGQSINLSDLKGSELEGREIMFEDVVLSGIPGALVPRLKNRHVCVRVFRNMSGVALLPKEVVFADPAAQTRVIGRVNTNAKALPVLVDEFLPTAGVPAGDLFYGVVRGPALAKTPVAGSAIPAGSLVVGATGSGATTAAAATTNECGRVAIRSFTAPTNIASAATLADELFLGAVGTAVTARTVGETNSDILIDVNIHWTPIA